MRPPLVRHTLGVAVKEICGSASAVVIAHPHECFSLLHAVDDYGSWNREFIRELDVLERDADGRAARVRGVVAVTRSPVAKTVELTVEVRADPPEAIYITRIPNEPSDREQLDLVWRVQKAGPSGGARIDVRFVAVASFVPAFVPLGGAGNSIARKLLESAVGALTGGAT